MDAGSDIPIRNRYGFLHPVGPFILMLVLLSFLEVAEDNGVNIGTD